MNLRHVLSVSYLVRDVHRDPQGLLADPAAFRTLAEMPQRVERAAARLLGGAGRYPRKREQPNTQVQLLQRQTRFLQKTTTAGASPTRYCCEASWQVPTLGSAVWFVRHSLALGGATMRR